MGIGHHLWLIIKTVGMYGNAPQEVSPFVHEVT